MKAKSAHNKGKRFENYLLQHFRENLDHNSHRNVGSGNGLDKGDLRLGQYVIEAKNQQTINLMNWWQQTKEQCFGDDIPILAIRSPKLPEFKETLIVCTLETFTELVGQNRGQVEVVETLDWPRKNALDNLIRSCKEVLKKFDE